MTGYGKNTIGEGAQIFEPITLGFPSRDYIGKSDFAGTMIGKSAVIRSGTIIYCDVVTGDNFQSGHNVMIRENTLIGDRVSIGLQQLLKEILVSETM